MTEEIHIARRTGNRSVHASNGMDSLALAREAKSRHPSLHVAGYLERRSPWIAGNGRAVNRGQSGCASADLHRCCDRRLRFAPQDRLALLVAESGLQR